MLVMKSKKNVQKQEQDLNSIETVVGDLSAIAETMALELDRQIEQLDNVSLSVEEANKRLHINSNRIQRI